jgi:hypothetical protein
LAVVKSQKRERDLPQVIQALAAPRGFARGLNRRQEQCDQNANNGNHNEQFNKRKCTSLKGARRNRFGRSAPRPPLDH